MILQSAKDYLAATNKVKIAHLVEIELAGTNGVFAYMTDYMADISYSGVEYLAGKVVSVGSVKLVQGLKNYTLQVNVAGEFQEEIDRGTTELSYEGRSINVYRAYLDDKGAIIPFDAGTNGPVKLFLGKISGVTVNEDVTKGSSVITWDCAGLLYDFEKVNGRITDDTSHRGLISNGVSTLPIPSIGAKKEAYKTDTGFQHANQTISASISYLGKEKEYYLKKSWLGLKSSLREREVTVQRNLDIKTSLEARHLPVVYGVRRLPGIPVFLDALVQDPSRMYCVYAVCEGEIDAFLDIYIDGSSAICSSATASTATGICVGNKQFGDTLSIYKDVSRTAERQSIWDTFPYDRDSRAIDSGYDQVSPGPSTAGTSHLDSFNILGDKGSIWVQFFHGKSNQLPCGALTGVAANNGFLLQNQLKKQDGSSWGPEYWPTSSPGVSGAALLDTAYVVVAFSITEDRVEIPNIEVVVSGRKPTVITSPTTYTKSYSLNPVWHLLDYLTDPIFGGGIDLSSEIDFASFLEVAQQLDATDTSYSTSYISWWRYIGWPTQNYSRALMQCNSVISTDNAITKNVEDLLSQFSGTLNPVDGKYHLSIENVHAPKTSIDIGEVIGRVSVKDTPNKDKWNSIQASIVDPAMDWGTNQITFFDSTYLAEDNNIHKKGNTIFSYITNYYTARAWAQRTLNISRSSRVLRFTTYYKYSWLLPNDIISFTYPRLGYTNSQFRVIEVEIESSGLVSLAIETYDPAAYTISSQPIINPPTSSGSNVLAPQYLDFDYLPNEEILIAIEDPTVFGVLSWELSSNPNILRYEGWYSPVGASVGSRTLISVPTTQTASIKGETKYYELVTGLSINKSYIFKVQSVSNTGVKSPYSVFNLSTPEAELVPGFIPAVENFRVINKAVDGTFIGPTLTLAWDLPEPVDYTFSFELRIKDITGSTILVLETLNYVTSTYDFTLEKNMAAYLAAFGTTGAFRSLTTEIRILASNGNSSIWSTVQ